MIAGTEVKIGEESFTMPPLPIAGVKAYLALIGDREKFTAMSAMDVVDRWIGFLLMALKRNYPDMTAEKISENLDLAQVREMLTELRIVSGLENRAPGETTPVA